jgi:hypothetical protein
MRIIAVRRFVGFNSNLDSLVRPQEQPDYGPEVLPVSFRLIGTRRFTEEWSDLGDCPMELPAADT